MNVNLNAVGCIKPVYNWGETVHHNICNDTIHVIEWGTMDYAVTIMLLAFVLTVAFGVGLMIFDIIFN